MIQSKDNFIYKQANLEKIIYQYLRNYVENNSPEDVINQFRLVFFEFRIQDSSIRGTLEHIIFSKQNQEKFSYILNYSYHIVINYWSTQVQLHEFIIQLINLIDSVDLSAKFYDRRRQKITELLQVFRQTNSYFKLKRIAKVLEVQILCNFESNKIIGEYLAHYPYLYQPLLLGKEYIPEEKKLIINLQETRQKQFEFQLSQHIIYRSRLIQVARARQLSHGAGKILRRVHNPTLLSERDVKTALQQYLNKINNQYTIYQLSQKFLIQNKLNISYQKFKHNLYHYLVLGLETRNQNNQFYKFLEKLIDESYYQSDSQKVNDSLILQTCRRLLRFLVVDTTTEHNHRQLIDLIMNLGTAQTVALLIKIVLICPQVKIDLEQRLGLLFSYYESQTIEEATWLIKFLENFLIAFSIHFGKVDLSVAKLIQVSKV